MKQQLQLHIPEPCHESWDNMSATEQGRFCMSCKKEVVDFSLMSDKEILKYISTASHSICGRANEDQLAREIIQPAERRFSFKYFWSVLITSTLIAGKASAQVKAPKDSVGVKQVDPSEVVIVAGMIATREISQNNFTISGRIVDEDGEAIPYASVIIVGGIEGTSTDANGDFSFTVKKYNRRTKIEVSSVGFDKRILYLSSESQINYADGRTQLMLKDIQLKKSVMGEVVVKSLGHNSCSRTSVGMMLVSSVSYTYFDKIKDTLTGNRSIKVYPNPISRNSVFKIEFNLKDMGEYSLQCMDASGCVLQTRTLNIAYKNQLENFSGSMFSAAGTYFINVKGKQSARTFSAKLLVQ